MYSLSKEYSAFALGLIVFAFGIFVFVHQKANEELSPLPVQIPLCYESPTSVNVNTDQLNTYVPHSSVDIMTVASNKAGTQSLSIKAPPLVVVYQALDGICYSPDGSRYNLFSNYPQYKDREYVFVMPEQEVLSLVSKLASVGFLEDKHRRLPSVMTIPPCSYDIIVRTPAQQKHVRFYFYKAGRIDEKYLSIFDSLPNKYKTPLLIEIIKNHRALALRDN
jgi:hypothetical protein